MDNINPERFEKNYVKSFISFSKTTAVITVIAGAVVLSGWIGGIEVLKSLIPGYVTMKVNTALCFMLSGFSLWLTNKGENMSLAEKKTILLFSSLTIIISVLSFTEYILKIDLGIDEVFFTDFSASGTSKPGLMSPITSFNFCLTGIAFLLYLFKSESYKIFQLFCMLIFGSSLLALIEIIYGVDVFYNVIFYTKMALPTSLMFILFSLGLISTQHEKGIITVYISNTVGGIIARQITPAIIIVPFVLGWVTQNLENKGLYESHFGHALFSVTNMLVFFALIIWTTHQLMKVDIERNKAEKERKKREEELTVANKELGQFVYAASHDLQEPLQTISNFVGLIETKYLGKLDKNADQYLKFISSASSKMKKMIKDLLDLARLESDIIYAEVDCTEILNEVIAEMDATIKESNAKMTFTKLPILKGNRMKLKHLFLHLICNAIKFSKKDNAPEVEITIEEKVNEYLFAFKDNGMGIEEKKISKLFFIFNHLNEGSDYVGSGIGLALCKKIVEQHKGRIWVESKLGIGSTFYFIISKNI